MVEARDLDIIFGNPIDWEKFRDKRILVTGATGRLGMYIVEALNKADIDWNLNLKIIIMARSKEKVKYVFKESIDLPNITSIVQDISEPISIAGNVDYIFHTAGMASPVEFTSMPVDVLWGHLQGTRNILELAKEKGTKKVIYISTVEIYGEWKSDIGIKECDMGVLNCSNERACYPEAKRMCETMLASYEAQYGIHYQVARLCHTFGPGISLDDGRAFAQFIKNVVNGENIVLQTDGSAMRTYTYVADAIGAIFLMTTKGKEHHYNIAKIDNLISIRDLATLIASMDPKHQSMVKFAEKSENKLKYLPFSLGIMNVDRIMDLGWRPKVGVQDAFKYTIDSFL